MTARIWLALGSLGVLVNSGCVTCTYQAQKQCLEACHVSPLDPQLRQHVYLFLMNGYDPLDCAGMTKLRDEVCAAGFPKVYFAQRADRRWYEAEIRRVACEDPAARFVLAGIGGAAEHLVPLAAGTAADGVAIDGLLLLDPIGELDPSSPVRTIVLTSKNWKHGSAGVELSQLQDAGHFALPTAPSTMTTVLELMSESAQLVGPLEGPTVPVLPLTDKPAPLPRPREVPLPGDDAKPDEWDFLKRTPPSRSEPLPYPGELPTPREVPAIPASRVR